ncbi:asparagine synthase-related protein [Streptomyces sp. NPDC057654]|uniref:asparagine synthase-related protein n=1 Tax=Streptomyces sp. NPDC057654 TaxID=3346196 RepID=UPI003674FD89
MMLKFSLPREAGPLGWEWKRGQWQCGRDWIGPLTHTALEARSVTNGTELLFVVRERAQLPSLMAGTGPVRVDQAAYDKALAEARTWPLQAVWIEVTGSTVRIETGLGGVCPLYLATDERRERLIGSWELTEVRDAVAADDLNEEEVARWLADRQCYGRATMFSAVQRLTERSTARFDRNGLRLLCPRQTEPAQMTPVSEDADAVSAFEELTAGILDRRPTAATLTAAQLTGGLHSTNVALSMALAHPGAVTACALLGGGPGSQEAVRRREVIRRAGVFDADCTVAVSQYPPLHPAGGRRQESERVSPLEGPYAEAAGVLADRLAERGITQVLTGYGGTEAFRPGAQPRTGASQERPDWWGPRMRALLGHEPAKTTTPPTVAPESALRALAAATPLLARRELWTLAPYTAPHMIEFGRQLPDVWKRNTGLLHQRLTRLGLRGEDLRPPYRLNLAPQLDRAIHRHAVPLLRDWGPDLYLIAEGYLNAAGFAQIVERAAAGPEHAAPYGKVLYRAAAIELAQRAL